MKKLLMAASILVVSSSAFAATESIEHPITGYSAPAAVSVSSSQYTNVTSAATRIDDMTAVLIDNPSTNSASVHGHIGNCTSTAISTSTVKGPIEISPSSNGGKVPIAEDSCLWLVSRNSSGPETVTVQGIKQKR